MNDHIAEPLARALNGWASAQTATRITEAEFRRMCERHDLTYVYSDDANEWRRGLASAEALREAARLMDRRTAVRIYNEVVDSKVVPQWRADFYWSE